MKQRIFYMIMISLLGLNGCTNYLEGNRDTQLLYAAFFSTAPVLNPLVIAGTSNNFITLARPTFVVAGSPAPSVEAYIGLDDGSMTISGTTVTGAIEGPVDVSAAPYQFNTGLSPDTIYRIYVVAINPNGYSVRTITQSTSHIVPVLDPLVMSIPPTSDTITLDQPTFSTAGNPLPTVEAYIGYAGGATPISITPAATGYTVANDLQGPVDVSAGGCQFTGLANNTLYRVYVVAQNMDVSGTYHQSIEFIDESTYGIAPVMDALVTTTIPPTTDTITLDQPTFSTAGNPLPAVSAYIGVDGFISVAGTAVSGATQGPIDVSSADYTFTGLANDTTYRIIVVAQNVIGSSVQQATQSTTGIAPAMNALVTTTIPPTTDTITLDQPTFATGGNPVPTVRAYIGIDGFITVAGTTVSGADQGPVNVAAAGCTFTGLANDTTYRIIVVAENSVGSSVQQATQSTGGIAPVMEALVITTVSPTIDTITLDQPTFTTGGNPAPTVKAYIGIDGFISVAGTVVTGADQGPINAASGGYTFTGLDNDTTYRIIVVAENTFGSSVQQTTQSTVGIAPVMDTLVTTTIPPTTDTITLDLPTFTTGGNPAPTVKAYIGIDGFISVVGTVVTGADEGPINVASAGYAFTGLTNGTTYRIIVVAENSAGSSVQQATETTLP